MAPWDGFEWQVLRNQVTAFGQNLWIWLLRAVVRLPPPGLLPLGFDKEREAGAVVEISGPGGVDRMCVKGGSWAVCGYNIMKAFGGRQRIDDPIEKGKLASDLVVVKNKAFSINYADVCVRWGLYESALRYVGWPIVPGFDIAGVVEAAGADTGFSEGERVYGCSLFGAYAGRVVVPASQLMHAPADLSFEAAASLPAVASTALHACNLAGVWPGEAMGSSKKVLVHSAAGGVGDLLCQMLRLCGMHVCGIVGSAAKIGSCKADVVIDKSAEDWVAAARRNSPDGYRAIFDANGVETLRASYELLCRTGRLVIYGFHSNLPKTGSGLGMLSPVSWLRMAVGLLFTPAFDPMGLVLDSKAVLGFNLSFFAEEHELIKRYLSQLEEWISSGKIVAPAVRTMALSEVREAHMALTSGSTVGKLVITL